MRAALDARDIGWAELGTDGLQVFLAGTAPDEAARFAALSAAGSAVDAERVIDQTVVEEAEAPDPPRFAIEILRNAQGVSLIGLVPATLDRAALRDEIAEATGGAPVTDMLETADYPAPETWQPALRYAVAALGELPRSKISMSAERVAVTAMADSVAEKRRVEFDLARRSPEDVRLALDISAPRPVITPFTLRFVIDDRGARFDACSADTEAARARILRAAGSGRDAGPGRVHDRHGRALAALGGGRRARHRGAGAARGGQRHDHRCRYRAARRAGNGAGAVRRCRGHARRALPEVFALEASLPAPEERDPAAPRFVATLSPEGQVALRGRVGSAQTRQIAASLARARFSVDAVHVSARVAEDLPRGWSMRVLLAVEALAHLDHGAVTVTPDTLDVRGQIRRRDRREHDRAAPDRAAWRHRGVHPRREL